MPLPCISARIFIIPKLQNVHWRHFYISEFSLCIERLPNSYSVSSHPNFYNGSDSFSEHISRALPTEMIFYLLRSIPSESLILYSGNLKFEMLEAIIKWLQVSVSEYATDQSEI